MSVALATLIARVEADPSDFQRGMGLVQGIMDDTATKARMLGQALSLAVTLPIIGLVQTALSFNDLKQRATIAFTALMGSADMAKDTIAALQRQAVSTPFDFPGLLEASQRLVALGVSAKNVIPTIKAITDAVAGVGGTDENVKRVSYALGQMNSMAVLDARVMRELVNNNIPAWDILSKQIGKPVVELRKLVTSGVIPAQAAFAMLVNGMENRFPNAAQKMSATFMAGMSNLKDAAIQALGDLFLPLTKSIVDVIQQLSVFLLNVKDIFAKIPDSTKEFISTMLIIAASIGPVIIAVSLMAKAFLLLTSPLGIAGIALAGLTAYFVTHREAIKTVVDFLIKHLPDALGIAAAALAAFSTVAIANAIGSMVAFGAAAITFLATPVGIAAALIGASVGFIAILLAKLLMDDYASTSGISDHWERLTKTIQKFVSQIIEYVKVLVRWFYKVLEVTAAVEDMFISFFEGIGTIKGDSTTISDNLQRAQQKDMQTLDEWEKGINNRVPGIVNGFKQLQDAVNGAGKAVKQPAMPDIPDFHLTDKNALKDAQKIDAYIMDLQKQIYSLQNTGKAAEVAWDIMYGVMNKAGAGTQQFALNLADTIDNLTKVKSAQDTVKQSIADMTETLAIGAEATESQRMAYRLTNGDLSVLDDTTKNYVFSLLDMVDGVKKHAQAEKDNTKIMQEVSDLALGTKTKYQELMAELRQMPELWAEIGQAGAEAIAQQGQANYDAAQEADRVTKVNDTVTESIKRLIEQHFLAGSSSEVMKVQSQLLGDTFKGLDADLKESWMLWAQLIDKQKEEQDILKVNQRLTQALNDELYRSNVRLQSLADLQGAGLSQFIKKFQADLDKLKGADFDAAMVKIKDAYKTIQAQDKQFQQIKGFRSYLADIQKQMDILKATNGFDAFKAGMQEIDDYGNLIPSKFNEEQLDVMFKARQTLDKLNEARDMLKMFSSGVQDIFQHMFENIGDYTHNFFGKLAGDFDKLLQKMAAQYLSSLVAKLFMKGLGWAFGAIGGAGATSGFGDIFGMSPGGSSSGPWSEAMPSRSASFTSAMVVPGTNAQGHAVSGGGSRGVTIIQNISTPDANSMRRSQSQMIQDASRAANSVSARNR